MSTRGATTFGLRPVEPEVCAWRLSRTHDARPHLVEPARKLRGVVHPANKAPGEANIVDDVDCRISRRLIVPQAVSPHVARLVPTASMEAIEPHDATADARRENADDVA